MKRCDARTFRFYNRGMNATTQVLPETGMPSARGTLSFLLVILLAVAFAAAPPARAATPTGDLVFQDDFSGDGGYLGTYEGDDGESRYEDGAYRMTVTSANAYIYGLTGLQYRGNAPQRVVDGEWPEDVSIEVDATVPGEFSNGRFGIGVGYQSDDSAYSLLLDGTGRSYTIARIEPLTPSQAQDPTDSAAFSWLTGQARGAPHPAIETSSGATNHLRVDWTHAGLALYVNGEKLVEYPLDEPVTGGLALFAYAGKQTPFEVDFNNLVVRRLSGDLAFSAARRHGGDILFEDDFSDPTSGWDTGPGDGATFAYEDGTYRVAVEPGSAQTVLAPIDGLGDVSAEVTFAHLRGQPEDYAGLVLRAIGDVYYDFLVSWDGTYMVSREGIDGDYATLVDWTDSAAIRTDQGAKNIVRADCVGDMLTFYINGQRVDQIRNEDIAAGGMGVEAGTPTGADREVEVAFENFILRQP